jgi:hypothetical protein
MMAKLQTVGPVTVENAATVARWKIPSFSTDHLF